MAKCCGKDCDTAFCPHCGKDIGGEHVAVLRAYLRKEYGSIKRAETVLAAHPQLTWPEKAMKKHEANIMALEAAMSALINKDSP